MIDSAWLYVLLLGLLVLGLAIGKFMGPAAARLYGILIAYALAAASGVFTVLLLYWAYAYRHEGGSILLFFAIPFATLAGMLWMLARWLRARASMAASAPDPPGNED